MSKITTYEELTLRINQLNGIKDAQEIELKNNLNQVYQKFQLKNILKETVRDLANDAEFRGDGFKAAGNMATDFVVGRLFNKNNTIRGFIATLLIEKLVTPLITNNKDKILSFISDLVSKFGHKKEE
ncbi:MAG TPA: hypothetical protein VK835_02220 [Bacteroidia bacterium]|jgi:hypothetical protein|nr:hypothetical protein [Bacteroidia bacterium]